ncbi:MULTISPECIES: efflux RND transporter periplasmic adaptor subunit [unclassified Agarivorans]|uniref:efflux RND transporter periplasmic adaptor subunit n=1 Tax=unclassified Agarivorans TaxID=2636026 RepID=UPI0026E20669|nr:MULTISPECIES: efflux RND transporter periplasmic adaptor subunit [unclassified Agarivorans]MDO6683975.1 efflux RND transporter periplasmic adaptor subunit [Agarivorans sp. 3_MG-2023]MDO6714292.1 efflux RND transporter periplasmic adaptor subunit [Agarivorans sp. 2_MG-2023]
MVFSRIKVLALAPALLLLSACNSADVSPNQVSASLVNAEPVKSIHYAPSQQFIGRIEAYKDVDIRAQVSGYLLKRHFEDGQMVEQGQLLYEIDPTRYQAAVAQAKAALAQAKANLTNAEINWKRGERLLPQNNISRSEYDRLTAEKLSSDAQLEAAEAQLSASLVDLQHTRIVAPFDGRIGQSEVSQGDLIASSNGRLTNLVSLNPIRAGFRVSERERLNMGLDQVDAHSSAQTDDALVQLKISDSRTYPENGQLDFIDNRIDLQTGTIAISAQFNNPQQQLLPGQYVEVKLTSHASLEALVIPRRAVQSDLEGEFVMLIGADNTAERRNVNIGPVLEQGVVITSGLNGNEQVITAGLQRVRHGAPVQVVEQQAG